MLRAGLIGFGGIAKAHRKAFAKLEQQGRAQLVCAYDVDPEAFGRKISINIDTGPVEMEEHIRFYTDLDKMLSEQELDFVSICAPSFLHSELSAELLRRGYHVLCEKPMALTYDAHL